MIMTATANDKSHAAMKKGGKSRQDSWRIARQDEASNAQSEGEDRARLEDRRGGRKSLRG